MISAAMVGGLETFVGRDAELTALRSGVRGAAEGAGGVWLIAGEAGIGKSRLSEELARAVAGDVTVAWGRCWEEGGAPPYWPWVQVLRALLRRPEVGDAPFTRAGRGPWLTQLVPELGDRVDGGPPALEPELSRFRLLDAAAGALSDAAQARPLLVILEDLHVADASSVELLEFLAKQIRGTRVALVGTLREAEARRGPGAAALARIAREAKLVALERLDRDAVVAYLRDALGRAPADALVDALLDTTEGNPLFLGEIVRRPSALAHLEDRGGAPVVPPSVQRAITERVAELSTEARGLLETASALGREVAAPMLAEVTAAPRASLTRALAEAVDHAVLVEVSPDVYRFSHILVRETLHDALDEARRHELHRRMASALERRAETPGMDVPWPQVAHHYLEAGPGARDDAIGALREAASQAAAGLAFAEAAGFARQALALLDDDREAERCEVLLALASALRHAGILDEARRACEAALELADRVDDPELYAHAALERGGVLDIGASDERLVERLERALARLEPGDSATRARVMARLGAARQPEIPPEGPFELVRRAIAMARRVSDEPVLLDVLRTGISAMMDIGDPRERLTLNREHAALAERLDAPIDALIAYGRMAFDALELGEPPTVHASIEACARIVERLDLGQHRWRVSALRSMCATGEGRFREAEALSDRAEAEAEGASDPWAVRSVRVQRHLRARLRGDWERALALLEPIDPLFAGFEYGRDFAILLRAATLADAGQKDAAAALFVDELVRWPIDIGDLSLMEMAATAALAADRRDVLARLVARLRSETQRYVSWGILGAAVGPPVAAIVGRMLVALGELREGEQQLREAHARARATTCAPYAAWIALDIARLPGAKDARARAAEALEAAERLDMPGLATEARAVLATLGEAAPSGDAASGAPSSRAGNGTSGGAASSQPEAARVEDFTMRREGGVWTVECQGRSFHLKDVKGLTLLSRLVAAPNEEHHVLDLESPTGAASPDTRGDAGEAIDEQARDAYRRRVESLREEIAEAETWNDIGRQERARGELDAIAAELARSVGLGGRARRSASQVERARVNVQRRLKDAIRRIEKQHPALGKHLARAVRTGTTCSYRPE